MFYITYHRNLSTIFDYFRKLKNDVFFTKIARKFCTRLINVKCEYSLLNHILCKRTINKWIIWILNYNYCDNIIYILAVSFQQNKHNTDDCLVTRAEYGGVKKIKKTGGNFYPGGLRAVYFSYTFLLCTFLFLLLWILFWATHLIIVWLPIDLFT